jgi:two-component system CheB/CheR fusion protein
MSPADEPLIDGTAPGDTGAESQDDVVDAAGQEANLEPHAGDPEPPGAASCTVVGIGASAGGLEAFSELLNALPGDTGMAFVLIQHLDPHHSSALAGLLGQHTRMSVVEVTQGTAVGPNRIYVIPPNATLTIARGVLNLTPRPEAGERYMPIDSFLRSLAADQRNKAIGVILSGAATDGTLGLRAIKAEGGITFAQDESAKFDGMPRSAVSTGVVDFVLSPDGIGTELAVIAHHPYRTGGAAANVQETRTFQRILRLVKTTVGVDFSQYKPNTLLRRMERRIVLQKAGDPDQYLQILQQNPAEVRSLSDDLLINVTEFFRDPPVFEALRETAFPAILRDRQPGDPIRVWVPGCSTGEEVYSIAICLLESMQDAGANFPLHIFGTDISERSIAKARAGIFAPSSVTAVSIERLKRFFVETDAGYQIVRSIRDRCIFALHNLASDPPFSRMDFISCRNLLIYLGAALQQRVIHTLFYALQPNGQLLLGGTETPGSLADYFTPFDSQHRIYTPAPAADRHGFELPARVATFPVFKLDENSPAAASNVPEVNPLSPLQRRVDRMLLSQYAPPSVVIDDKFGIVEFRGHVGPYLAPQPGEAGLDLFRMLREDVALHVGAAVEEARQKNMGIRVEGIQVPPGGPQSIAVAVTPLNVVGFERHFLVSFEEAPRAGGAALPATAGRPEDLADPLERISQLETELASTRRYLQSIIEELRSANEEAQSTNEELLSSNEELQTAKEELQASNEELQTLNSEMEGRNAELKVLTDDLLNLLASLQNPILMLDASLRIRRFTQASEKLLNLIPADIGRPVSDLKPRINAPQLEETIRRVLDTLAPEESEVQDQEGRWYSLRVRPYRTSENRIDGAVLQLVDVDQLKRTLEQVKSARDYASAIVETVREPLIVLGPDLRIETANRSFFQMFGTSPEESLNRPVYEVGGGQFNFPRLRDLLAHVAQADSTIEDVEIERDFERIGRKTLLLNARRIERDGSGGLILLAFEDVTERKRAAEARYRRLFEAAKDGMLIVDAETAEITDANPFMEVLFGYRREDFVGRKVWESEPLRDVPDLQSTLERPRGQDLVRFPDQVLKSRSGRAVRVEIVTNEYREEGRRVVQFNIRDITERWRFEHQLQHTQKLESLGVLAGGIAHDFNNLLSGIMGNASLGLTELPDAAPARRYLREIVSASRRASNLTRQMLAYAGKGRFVVERIDLSQLVREIEPLIHTSIPKLVDIQLVLGTDLPAVEADPGQIQQLVMNLIINGAEAIGEGKPGAVWVRTDARDLNAEDILREFPHDQLSPGAYVGIEVCDTGSGMNEATKAKIFDPFFTTKFQGRGLGLAAVSGIVRTQKGAIHVFSAPGHGTSFQVLFPAVAAKAADRTPRIPQMEAPAGGTVLFVDDEEMLRSFAQAALEKTGWQVLLAENGAEGVRLFEEHQAAITLVVLDMTMPVMGGAEALDRIKAIRPSVPVILSTGYGESEAARLFAGKNIAGYLGKPYTVDQLMEMVAAVLSRK